MGATSSSSPGSFRSRPSGVRRTDGVLTLQNSAGGAAPNSTNHTPRQPGELAAKSSLGPSLQNTTPPTSSLTFSFSSLIPTFYRPAASTVCSFSSVSRKLCITFIPARTYASAKKQKMPPKKAVKEEKVHLGRPGNSLKSGIVSESPALRRRRVLTLTVVARSA
jgi:hypothetical protein